MPHKCVHCGKLIEENSREVLEGCGKCGSKFFFYIRKEQMDEAKKPEIIELKEEEKKKIEEDVREIMDVKEEVPVILDLESVRTIKPGKYEIDVINLFNKKRPIVYKISEGKYIIDLASTLQINLNDLKKKVK